MALPEDLGHEPIRGQRRVDQGRPPPREPGEARVLPPLRRAPGRRRPPRGRVLPRLPDPGHELGRRLGRRSHLDRGPRALAGPATSPSSRPCSRADAVDAMPSGELVAAVIQCMLHEHAGVVPAEPPQRGPGRRPPARRRGREHVRRRRRRRPRPRRRDPPVRAGRDRAARARWRRSARWKPRSPATVLLVRRRHAPRPAHQPARPRRRSSRWPTRCSTPPRRGCRSSLCAIADESASPSPSRSSRGRAGRELARRLPRLLAGDRHARHRHRADPRRRARRRRRGTCSTRVSPTSPASRSVWWSCSSASSCCSRGSR